jgi:Ca2+/Na+ antiporter
MMNTSRKKLIYRTRQIDKKNQAKDVLLALNREYYGRIQHYETQRSAVSNLLVIVAAAILAFVTFDRALTIADLALTLLLFAMGLFGAAFSAKYHERASRQSQRVKATRLKLDELLFDSALLDKLRDKAENEHAVHFPKFHHGRIAGWKIYRLWITFHLFIALLGCILTILIYFL